MSVQSLWSVIAGHPGQALNAVALFLALAGSWLLLATRLRESRAATLLAAERGTLVGEAPNARINLFFYRFSSFSLAAALALSWLSTGL